MKGMKGLVACCLAVVSAASLAQERDFSQVEIATHRLAENLYCLEGAGGKIKAPDLVAVIYNELM